MKDADSLEARLAGAVPLAVYRSLVRRPAIGLVYHMVSAEPPAHIRHIYPVKTPEMFIRDLEHLQAKYTLISYEQLAKHARGEARLQPNSVLLTFDDGYAECFSVVRPLLLRHGVPCVFFLTTDFLDNRAMFYRNKYSLCVEKLEHTPDARMGEILHSVNRQHGQSLEDRDALLRWLRSLGPFDEAILDAVCDLLEIDLGEILHGDRPYLTGEEVKTLAADGFTIGAHGRRHVKFNLLDSGQIQEQILSSCEAVRALSGQRSVPFSFPFSGYGVDRRFLARLRAEHEHLGLFFETTGLRKEPPFIVSRVWADPPPEPGAAGSNLDQLLHAAYREYALWRRKYFQTVLRARMGFPSPYPEGSQRRSKKSG